MIFPQVSTEEWIDQHKELYVAETKCAKCFKAKLRTTRPFIEKNWLGLISPPCSNCGWNSGFSVQSSRSMEQDIFCNSLVKEWQFKQALKKQRIPSLKLVNCKN